VSLAATFLGGAQGRLLPASIPFRFFAAAAAYYLALWVVTFFAADDLPGFSGGPGPALAVVHLLTLGVLGLTAMGASFQLLPVATRRALAVVWPMKLAFWLAVPGIAVLTFGMFAIDPLALTLGAIASAAGFLVMAVMLADNLARAKGLAVVAAYGWMAVASLLALLVLGVALAADLQSAFLADRGAMALAHFTLAVFGFMGLLAIGFSHVLVPMFALTAPPPRRAGFTGAALAGGAVLSGTLGALFAVPALLAVALAAGLAASAVYLWTMNWVMTRRMRKRMGTSFVLIRISWVLLPTSLILGALALAGVGAPFDATLFAFVVLWGWLLTFLLGIWQRIVPFLTSMHAAKKAGKPPLVSELTPPRLTTTNAVCHLAAISGLALGLVLGDGDVIRAAALVGILGAGSFAWFIVHNLRHLPRGKTKAAP
jgi:hypothetical protein